MMKWTTLLLLFVTMSLSVPAAELGFMPQFPEEERDKAHVFANSHTVAHDFVDGQWEGIIAASDGKTYFSVSSHSKEHNAQFYRYDPQSNQVEHLIDVGEWCGETESIGKLNTQGKIHSTIYEGNGKLYCSTTSAHATFDHPYTGGWWLAYDLESGAFERLAHYPSKDGGLLTMLYEPVYQRLYAINQYENTLCYYDLKSGEVVTIGSIQDGAMQCRVLISDRFGVVYGSDWGGKIYRYNPETQTMGVLLTEIPHDPKAPQPAPDPKSQGWMKTMWSPIIWDAKTEWWYAVRGNDEYLFRFRPPADPRLHRGEIEGLAPLGYRPSEEGQPRFASLSLTQVGRTLYYCSYPIWRSMAHLMSYDMESGQVTNHGPIVTDDWRRVSEIHSMVAGPDGKLHAVAMVWSYEGEDPAKPWANRAQCYFHARFLTIDPAADFKHQ